MEKKELKSDKIINYILKFVGFLKANSLIVGIVIAIIVIGSIVGAYISNKNHNLKLANGKRDSLIIHELDNKGLYCEDIGKMENGELKNILSISCYLNNDIDKLSEFISTLVEDDFSTPMYISYFYLAKAVVSNTDSEKVEFYNLSINRAHSYDTKFLYTTHFIDYLIDEGSIIMVKDILDAIDYQDRLSDDQSANFNIYEGKINQLYNQLK